MFDLIRRVPSASKRVVFRGQIYWCDFGENVGSEQCKKRPALILQNNLANKRSPNTIVAPLTSEHCSLNTVFALPRSLKGCSKNSYVLTSNIVTISKARLGDFVDELTHEEMEEVERCLYRTLSVLGKIEKVEKQLVRTNSHLEKVKKERNEAQDVLALIKKELAIQAPGFDAESIISVLRDKIKKVS